ncbi:hypothetical protein CTZ27_19005 [Streptomyces griseocarneus]|nr:hypothetical protein CTZ27_19005 [Streptomyces griseocarneus]
MHFHGYLWLGPKAEFDKESVRRPPSPMEPAATSPPDVVQRYREAVTEWRTTSVPPLETAYWLLKPATLVRDTWEHPEHAADWLSERLTEHVPHLASHTLPHATETLALGGDVSLGYYLSRPRFLSLAVVTCSPNRTMPQLPCPTDRKARDGAEPAARFR